MVKLQVLLRPEWRTSEGIATVRRVLAELGVTPTASGLVTVSAEAEPHRVAATFGVSLGDVEKAQSEPVVDQPANLRVPDSLQSMVQNITIAPPHIYLAR